jgi:prepilin-type N-terminal cleavage/methylation domain-containing protein
MTRRAFTLIEVLVAMVLFVSVGALVMMVFTNQNRSFKTESDKVDVAMMAQGTLDELTRAVRMTGGGLPDGAAGLKVWGGGEERATFVMNETRGVDTVSGSTYIPSRRKLRIAVRDASRFSDSGFARVTLLTPSPGNHAPFGSMSARIFTLGVLERVARSGGCGDSLVLDATPLVASPNRWDRVADVRAVSQTLVHNVDSLTYRKSGDTLYLRQNRQGETRFALGVDSLTFRYWHPAAGWLDSLSGAKPANRIDKVWIRLVMRTRVPDAKLGKQDPASRGYRFAILETEVSLRNTNLVNR